MDQQTARDVLYAFGRDRYTDASRIVLGTPGQLRYGGAPDISTPADDAWWCRVTTMVTDEPQETLRNGAVRRFCTTGMMFYQLFCPVVDERALPRMDAISEILKNAFRTYQNQEIEFTNAKITDNVAREPNWLRSNITATYQYRQFI